MHGLNLPTSSTPSWRNANCTRAHSRRLLSGRTACLARRQSIDVHGRFQMRATLSAVPTPTVGSGVDGSGASVRIARIIPLRCCIVIIVNLWLHNFPDFPVLFILQSPGCQQIQIIQYEPNHPNGRSQCCQDCDKKKLLNRHQENAQPHRQGPPSKSEGSGYHLYNSYPEICTAFFLTYQFYLAFLTSWVSWIVCLNQNIENRPWLSWLPFSSTWAN